MIAFFWMVTKQILSDKRGAIYLTWQQENIASDVLNTSGNKLSLLLNALLTENRKN